MRNKNLKLLALILTGVLMVGCSPAKKGGEENTNTDSNDEPQVSLWAEDIKAEMLEYIGEELPYVAFKEETFYHDIDDTYADEGYWYYVIGDDNEENLLEGYGDLLIAAGYEYNTDETYGDYYTKTINNFEVEVTFDYYEATASYDAGNEIEVLIPEPTSGGGDVDPISGDELTQASFGLSDGNSTYGDHTATGASGATYTAQCASQHGIQIRSKNSNSGIIGHNASSTCKSIQVTFNPNTDANGNERILNIYASNTSFTIADMYGSSVTKVGSLTFMSAQLTQTYTFTSEYHYIGLRSNDGAIYLDKIVVAW